MRYTHIVAKMEGKLADVRDGDQGDQFFSMIEPCSKSLPWISARRSLVRQDMVRRNGPWLLRHGVRLYRCACRESLPRYRPDRPFAAATGGREVAQCIAGLTVRARLMVVDFVTITSPSLKFPLSFLVSSSGSSS